MNSKVFITKPYITLGQMLKRENIVNTGGQVKGFLIENKVTVNGVREVRRGRKLYPGDVINIESVGTFTIIS